MKKNSQVNTASRNVIAQLSAGTFGHALRRFDLDDNPAVDQHVDAVESDLLAPKDNGHWELTSDSQPSLLHRYFQCARVQ
jgi:hypothetical protein